MKKIKFLSLDSLSYIKGEFWYFNGRYHREDGPAIVYEDGYKAWYVDNKLHREDGPAIIDPFDGDEWYIMGRKIEGDDEDNSIYNKQ